MNLRYEARPDPCGGWVVGYERAARSGFLVVCECNLEQTAKAEARRLQREAELYQARLDIERTKEGQRVNPWPYLDTEG